MNLKILGIKFFFVLFVFSFSTLPVLSSQEEERLPEQRKRSRDFHSEEPPKKRPCYENVRLPSSAIIQIPMQPNEDGEITLRDNLALALGQFASDEYLLFLLQTENNIPKDCVSKIFSALSPERSLSFLQYIKRQENWASIQEAVFPRLREFWSAKEECGYTLINGGFSVEEVLNGPYSQLRSPSLSIPQLQSLSNNSTLTSLAIFGIEDNMGDTPLMLAEVLNTNQTLRSFGINSSLGFSFLDVCILFKGLQHNTALRDLRFSLKNEKIPYASYLKWGYWLSGNKTLTSLDVSFVPFNAAAALLTVPTLRCLAINGPHGFFARKFECDEAANFLSALEQNTTLQSLDIACPCLQVQNDDKLEAVEAFEIGFAHALHANTTITSLIFRDIFISDIGASSIVKVVMQKTNLTHLGLAERLRGQQIWDLADMIRNNPNLISLAVNPEFDPESAKEFCEAVIYNRTHYKTLSSLNLKRGIIPESCLPIFRPWIALIRQEIKLACVRFWDKDL